MEINMQNVDGDAETLNCNVVSKSEICRCNELEERSEKAEARCAELEFELKKKKNDCEALEAKLNALEGEKFAIEDKLKFLSISSEKLKENQVSSEKEREKKTDVDSAKENEGEDKVVQLMIEINVLEYEKKRAENEVQVWKERFKKLESWALQLGLGCASLDCHEENGKKQDSVWVKPEENSHFGTSLNFLQNQGKVVDLTNVASCISLPAGTPSDDMCRGSLFLHSKEKPGRKVRKQLAFEPEQSPGKKMAPSTPIGAKPDSVSVINIIDSDDEPSITQQPLLISQGSGSISCFAAEKEKMSVNSLKGRLYVQNNNEDLNFGEDIPFIATPKRKRTCNVVMSESESDDNVPICKLKRMHIQGVSPEQGRCNLNKSVTATTSADDKVTGTVMPRRRLMPLRKCVIKSQEGEKSSCGPTKAKHLQSILTNKDAGYDDELEEDLSGSEEESLSNFIVDDSDASDCKETSSKSLDVGSDSQDVSDEDMDFSKILSRIQRNKDQKMKWEFEADLLAAFGKDPELCMKAVCTLYRRQTSEEQMSKGSLYYNQRGFSKIDALRGSTLAEYLTDGDALGDIKKSVKELQEYDPKAVELCRTLAIRYSKQLFEIYKNGDDPFFP